MRGQGARGVVGGQAGHEVTGESGGGMRGDICRAAAAAAAQTRRYPATAVFSSTAPSK